MSRIGSSLSGNQLALQFNIQQAFADLAESGLKLSTLKRVNRGSDDPAALIAIGDIEAELVALEQADENASRASGAVRVADSALGQVSNLLTELQGHVVAAADSTLSDAARAAHQIEADSAIDAINHIGRTTSLGGRNLLDGSSPELHFVLSTDVGQTVTLNLPHVSSATLGEGEPPGENSLNALRSGGAANLIDGDRSLASQIIRSAASQVNTARARVGAFERYTIDAGRQVLQAAEVNLSDALSRIRDTDVAAEAARHIQARIRRDASLGAALLASRSDRSLQRGALLLGGEA
jgi:flagellin